ncbi:hypothetical protein FHT86_005594 [Rhizobium sp. BK313]|nr:hypothetical protein [Rhizobium sp. BK313]
MLKRIATAFVFVTGLATGVSAEEVKPVPPAPANSVTITLTAEQVAALPQILDTAIRQMGLSPGTVTALQIAQSVSLAQQKLGQPGQVAH